ncbi:MAG TPA: PrsW family glutamic-type intramembrane protease, partial [Blastocatellia bacterium]|nr:PrsW family glutamic-type intramembrane protease [Blastocatellia bacterium]
MKTLALSVLPCAIWLAWFWFQDWYDREPWRTVILTFLLGAAATVAALVFNTMGTLVVSSVFGVNPFSQILVLFLVIGPVEEAVKMAAVLAHAYRRPEFNE